MVKEKENEANEVYEDKEGEKEEEEVDDVAEEEALMDLTIMQCVLGREEPRLEIMNTELQARFRFTHIDGRSFRRLCGTQRLPRGHITYP